MVWDGAGYIFNLGALDFAGGTVVHINAGVAALVGAIVIGKRKGYGKDMMAPHSMTLTLVGAGILWVGWFGFNTGSNLEANGGAGLALINTFVATAGAILGWTIVEGTIRGKVSLLGAASGMIAGLVAITPACAAVSPLGSMAVGLGAAAICYLAVTLLKPALGYDDSLDVFGVHGIGGAWGALATGIFIMSGELPEGVSRLGQIGTQATSIAYVAILAPVLTLAILFALKLVFGPLTVSAEAEHMGLDLAEHSESAYVV